MMKEIWSFFFKRFNVFRSFTSRYFNSRTKDFTISKNEFVNVLICIRVYVKVGKSKLEPSGCP